MSTTIVNSSLTFRTEDELSLATLELDAVTASRVYLNVHSRKAPPQFCVLFPPQTELHSLVGTPAPELHSPYVTELAQKH
jgi:hypothetical protein